MGVGAAGGRWCIVDIDTRQVVYGGHAPPHPLACMDAPSSCSRSAQLRSSSAASATSTLARSSSVRTWKRGGGGEGGTTEQPEGYGVGWGGGRAHSEEYL